VQRLNLSDASPRISWKFRLKKLLRFVVALAKLALLPRFRGATLYMPLNKGGAMYYNLAALLVARLRGWRTLVHHHVYLYLRNYDWRVRVLDRLLGPRGMHLVLCPDMRRRLVDLYDAKTPFAYLPSTIVGSMDGGDSATNGAEARAPRRLGHISNLTEAKGALLAIRTFAKLRAKGHDVEMILAGPSTEPAVDRAIEDAQREFGASFDYRGPVYGEAKQRFFQDIDVLLFPSTFRLEAQPIVLSEAFAFGKPALAIAISCVPSLIGPAAWHVCPKKDFIEFATALIAQWQANPEEYATAQEYARRRSNELSEEAARSLARLADWIEHGESRDFVADAEEVKEPLPCG
jgi:glycosyltransferase involved in cell wall biosynthesis